LEPLEVRLLLSAPSLLAGVQLKADGQTIAVDGGDSVPYVVDWTNDGKKDLLVGLLPPAVPLLRIALQPVVISGTNFVSMTTRRVVDVRRTDGPVLRVRPRHPAAGGPSDLPPSPRHGRAYVIGFCDGHVEAVDRKHLDRLIWDPTEGKPNE
jgi:prepilin-type processing-associated H-X9-DG protein